jgi:hypothetical protein
MSFAAKTAAIAAGTKATAVAVAIPFGDACRASIPRHRFQASRPPTRQTKLLSVPRGGVLGRSAPRGFHAPIESRRAKFQPRREASRSLKGHNQ